MPSMLFTIIPTRQARKELHNGWEIYKNRFVLFYWLPIEIIFVNIFFSNFCGIALFRYLRGKLQINYFMSKEIWNRVILGLKH